MFWRICLFIFAAVLLLTAPVSAQESPDQTVANASEDEELDFSSTDWSTARQLQPNAGWRFGGQALMAPIWFFANSLMHEGSHALMGLACGLRVNSFNPHPLTAMIPSSEEDDEARERFYLVGLTTYATEGSFRPWQTALTAIAPFMTDTLLFLTGDLLLEYVIDPHSIGAPFALVGLMMTPLADFILGLCILNEGSDLHMFSDATGIPVGLTAGLGWIMALASLWRVAHQFRRVFFEPVPDTPQQQSAVMVMPIAGEDMSGLGVIGRF